MPAKGFHYKHRVAYHETDAMGVVHHSNHIKYFEEARVEFLRARGFMNIHAPVGPLVFAVVDLDCRYTKTARFDDLLAVFVEAKLDGARIRFQYAIFNERTREWIASGTTTLVPINADMRPARLPAEARAALEAEPWSDAWPPQGEAAPL